MYVLNEEDSDFCSKIILHIFEIALQFYTFIGSILHERRLQFVKVLEESWVYIVILVVDGKIFQSSKSDGMENVFLPLHFLE